MLFNGVSPSIIEMSLSRGLNQQWHLMSPDYMVLFFGFSPSVTGIYRKICWTQTEWGLTTLRLLDIAMV